MPDQPETPSQRRERYLRNAMEAEELAASAHDEGARLTFSKLAESWLKLAQRTEVRQSYNSR